MDLPQEISESVEGLAEQGSDLFDQTNFAVAIEKRSAALELVPEPRVDWSAYRWLSASIGDALYQLGDYDAARHSFYDARNGPGGQENPFVHYRLGQCLVELGHEDLGVESLLKAYMLDGEALFLGEPDGPAYLQSLRDRKLID